MPISTQVRPNRVKRLHTTCSALRLVHMQLHSPTTLRRELPANGTPSDDCLVFEQPN